MSNDEHGGSDCTYLSADEMGHFQEYMEGILQVTSPGVWHELASDTVHLDILSFPPSKNCNCWTFVTMGASALEMTLPDWAKEEGVPSRMELMISMPGDWIEKDRACGDKVDFTPEQWLPIKALKDLARYVFDYDTCFLSGHTFAWRERVTLVHEGFTGALLYPPVSISSDKWVYTRPDGETVKLLALYPLFDDELDFKLKNSTDDLLDKLAKAGVNDLFNPRRQSSLKKKPRFKFWN